jgi:hypothetical protein
VRGGRLYGGYEKLDPEERFSLLVAAEGRTDADEVERLRGSCPTRVYQLPELSFTGRLDLASRLTLAVIASLDALAAKLDVIQALEQWGKCSLRVAADAAEFEAFRITGELEPPVRRAVRRELGHFRRLPRRLRESLMADGATVARAFARVCTEHLEVDAHDLVAAFAADDAELFDRFFARAADWKRVDALAAEIAEEWHRWLGDANQAKAAPK